MGFVTAYNSMTGRYNLACDVCGKSGGVRKHKCPFGWCQSLALCNNPDCLEHKRKDHKYHKNCEEYNKEYEKKEEEKNILLADGKYLRCAALSHGEKNPRVKVIFRNILKLEKAFFMSHETYDSIKLGDNATIEDFAKNGQLQEAENTNIYDNQ